MEQIATSLWKDYELLDSGNLLKYERFGSIRVVRPEPLALWLPENRDTWKPDATYTQSGREGRWQTTRPLPEPWTVSCGNLTFGLHLASFKHVGLFPEHAPNWAFIKNTLKPGDQLLNLFGYTGAASIAGAAAGADVVHLDASKPAVTDGKRNQLFSELEEASIRWIVDDAKAFVNREVRRGHTYDMVLMDPPAFGRGPKGETWQFESDLAPFLESCRALLKPGGHLIVNAYALGFPARAIEQTVRSVFETTSDIECIDLMLQESTSRGFLLPAGVTIRARL